MKRTAYPRPELTRKEWTCLNGEWEFDFDFGKSGKMRDQLSKEYFDHKIEVPFCPESRLSGIGHRDFIGACWYRRKIDVPNLSSSRYILNFEAVYHTCEVFVNGKSAGTHKGGYTPFSFDITDLVTVGENTVAVYAEGDSREKFQPSGKQCRKYDSYGCYYTRSTGIYAPVWSEIVPAVYLKDVKLDTDIDNSTVFARMTLCGDGEKTVELHALLDGKKVGQAKVKTTGNFVQAAVEISKLALWSIDSPTLYDLEITVSCGKSKDEVKTYFGMRKVELDKTRLLINGKPVFMRLVLDQGYYGNGVYTAEHDDDFEKDIKRSQRLGFNGARLHERVFERRFLYDADRLGYIVWGEYPNWGFNHTEKSALKYYLPEWMEAMERDYNHPALIGWCPFNETWDIDGNQQDDDFIREIYHETKRFDKNRPVIDTSGNYHVETDIYDIHDYNQSVEAFERRYSDEYFETEGPFENYGKRQSYGGQPYFISEYGGIRWTRDAGSEKSEKSWGYGDSPKTLDEFVERFTKQTLILKAQKRICGLCYTQLYDVEQEQNGLYYYDRTPKFDDETMDKLKNAVESIAECEK
ncbi:MAG: beta-galactosidase [Clostridia bacterium]|nr:beta-galactosidase [Clostridia bacterium]